MSATRKIKRKKFFSLRTAIKGKHTYARNEKRQPWTVLRKYA